jgi:hypothetical protein
MKKLLLFFILISFFVSIYSCKSDKNKKTDSDTVVVETDEVQTFYLVPSPEDVFGFANDKNLKFNKDLLNPISNLSKYNDTKLQEFNFGIYAADLAYSAALSKNDETVQYINIVRELSNKIGLSEVFNESLIKRIENVSPQKDSLISLSNNTYFDIIRFLERNDKTTTLAIIATGGWLECMYLVVNLVAFDEKNPTIQKVADQKMIITNLWNFLKQNEKDANISSIMTDLKPLYEFYSGLASVEVDNSNMKTNNNEIIIVGGNSKVVINSEQYDKLKKMIIDIRNKITLNNVTL